MSNPQQQLVSRESKNPSPLYSPPPSPKDISNNNNNGAINSTTSKRRIYRSFTQHNNLVPAQTKWATREIAALDFLLNIPLQEEREIIRSGLEGRPYRNPRNIKQQQTFENPNTPLIPTPAITPSQSIVDLTALSRVSELEDVPILATNEEDAIVNKGAQKDGARWWDKIMLKEKSYVMENQQKASLKAQLELEEKELELPDSKLDKSTNLSSQKSPLRLSLSSHHDAQQQLTTTPIQVAPGRKIGGRHATIIKFPSPPPFSTRQKAVARNAAIREWERSVIHGIKDVELNPNTTKKTTNASSSFDQNSNRNSIINDVEKYQGTSDQGLLDGRIFFSAKSSYPIGVFSVVKYQPFKEEAARRRKKLEQMGGGGTKFAIPPRDWRGISYRVLLRRREKKNKPFRRIMNEVKSNLEQLLQERNTSTQTLPLTTTTATSTITNETNDASSLSSDNESITSSSSSSSANSAGGYPAGFLDDPTMVQGRHRHVMFGDNITGPIVASTIQFVKPADLKANLNKRFRERFDSWEPPKRNHGLIRAVVIDGVYTFMDNDGEAEKRSSHEDIESKRIDGGKTGDRSKLSSSVSDKEQKNVTLRMPLSLTLSKIRNVKRQALDFCVKANLEVSTVALACAYFERLCLDCHVDKSNRRLTFASCLLIAAKINEANVVLVHNTYSNTSNDGKLEKNNSASKARAILYTLVKPTKRSGNMFASLLGFFTTEWNLNLRNLKNAEWRVFAALGFRLHVPPKDLAMHFKRLMKAVEKEPLHYLGPEFYNEWQDCLIEDDMRRLKNEAREREKQEKKEHKLIKLQRKLQLQQSEDNRRKKSADMNEHNSSNDRFNEKPKKEQEKDPEKGKVLQINRRQSETNISRNENKSFLGKKKYHSTESFSDKDFPKKVGHTNSKKLFGRWRQIKQHNTEHSELPSENVGKSTRSTGSGTSSMMKRSVSSPDIIDLSKGIEDINISSNILRAVSESEATDSQSASKIQISEAHSRSNSDINGNY